MVVVMAVLLAEVPGAMTVPGKERGNLCLPGLTPFIQTYIRHYYYREVHVVFNGTGK